VVQGVKPCFRGRVFAEAFNGDDPLLRHVRTRVKSPQTHGVIDRFFGTLKYEHQLDSGEITDGDTLAVEATTSNSSASPSSCRAHERLSKPKPPCRKSTGSPEPARR